MNERIRGIERQSGIELYGLGKDRSEWQQSLEKFSELLIKETMKVVADNLPSKSYVYQDIATAVTKHFDFGLSIKVGSRVQVLSGFNVGAKGTVSYVEPSGKLWVMRDGASSDVFYHPEEVVGI